MPQMFLVGGPTHRQGSHTIHCPKVDSETGKPLTGADRGLVSVEFVNGRADVTDAGLARWLRDNGHATGVAVPAYGLMQAGVGPVLEHDEAGNAVVVEPAQPAELPAGDLPGDAATSAGGKKKEG